MDTLYVVMPAYNEQACIRHVVGKWCDIVKKVGPESRLLVINDGSTDWTDVTLLEMAEKNPQLMVVTKKNEGHGATILYGYKLAIEEGADYIFQTDSDGQTRPDEFWQFWNDREKCGLLIGNRTERQDGFLRVLVAYVLRLLLFVIFRASVKDANTPFRLMKADELKDLLDYIPEKYNLTNVIITVLYTKFGKTYYYPITFRGRWDGENSVNLKKIFMTGICAVRDFVIIRNSINSRTML